MGRRGPKPTPSEQLKRQGRYRADRRKNEPEPPAEKVAMPEWVSEQAQAHWRAIAPWLEESGLLTVLDTVALGLMCDAMAEYLEAGEVVEEAANTDGVKFVATTEKGNIIQHPAVGVRNKAWDRVVKLLREFGMTPSARAGMAIANANSGQEEDPLLKLMKDRMGRG